MMYEQGYSKGRIAQCEGIPYGSVHGIATRYTQQISGRDLPRPGQPKKLSPRNKRNILRIIEEDPFITNKNLVQRTGVSVSVATLTSYLKSQGIQHRRALQRPKLTPTAAARRLEFAREHIQKPISWWRKVIWSDEVTVARGDGLKSKWCFCQPVRICNTPENVPQLIN